MKSRILYAMVIVWDVGATAFVTHVSTQDFAPRTAGARADVDNRVEIPASAAR